MNKAFIKEVEGDDDNPSLPPLSAGDKNYITPQGFARLQAELKNWVEHERPQVVEAVHWAASNGDRSENGDYLYGKKRLREIDRRIRFLIKRLEMAVVADPALHYGNPQVFFGATVTYANLQGTERTVTIVGIDETNSDQGDVSWVSPIARTLLKANEGDVLKLITPDSMEEIEVIRVSYPRPTDATEG